MERDSHGSSSGGATQGSGTRSRGRAVPSTLFAVTGWWTAS
ncbi:TMPRSS13 isoform 2 [Pan troglodytes]|uniref:TMPRSS13 isoform 2 n=1 Tax=Pan troglodytes TaxID=9598 RepID=A0A2J8N2T4_PANTR|nr:TMPRSS13 isoform 2 [Pan troglodytes]